MELEEQAVTRHRVSTDPDRQGQLTGDLGIFQYCYQMQSTGRAESQLDQCAYTENMKND